MPTKVMMINLYFLLISVLFGANMGMNLLINNENQKDSILMRNTTTLETISQLPKPPKLLHVKISEDGLLNFTGLAKKYIKPAEEFDVITEDGYILKLFHIPGNKKNIVLLGHGLFTSSDDLIMRGNISAIYIFAQKGFDIWAMNFRGNRYSRDHITLNPDTDKEFWQYSMHDMAVYDYKATIDFILKKTGEKQLSVVAGSEGASAFFILLTERPEYNHKIKIFIGLAAVCYLRNVGPILSAILPFANYINEIFEVLNIEEVFGFYSIYKQAYDIICSQGIVGYELCFNLMGLITGFIKKNIEYEFASTIIGHFPTGSSRKNILHYMHVHHYDKFCKYDYGINNLDIYGSRDPPAYDLMKVTAKVALFAAKGDLLADIKDIERLKNNLPNVVHYQVVSDDNFNHLDYIWSNNAHIVLYPYIVELLTDYNMNS